MEQKQHATSAPAFHHVHIFCHDLDRMIDFWVRTFGLTFIRKRKFGDNDGADLDFGAGALLYLKQVDPNSTQGERIRIGTDHVGMMVPNLEAFLDSIKDLPDVAMEGKPFQSMELYCAFIRGPEGLPIEIAEYRPQ
jgi:catechol-2,3-dioxygenase